MTDPMSQLCWIFTTLMMLQLGLRTRRGGSELRSSERSRGYEEQHGEGATQGFHPRVGRHGAGTHPRLPTATWRRRSNCSGAAAATAATAAAVIMRRAMVLGEGLCAVCCEATLSTTLSTHTTRRMQFSSALVKKRGSVLLYVWGKTKDFLLCSLLFIVMGLLDPPYVLLLRSVRDGELCAPKQ